MSVSMGRMQTMGRTDFSDQFRKIITRHKHIGYDLNVMRQSVHFSWLGLELFCLLLGPPGLNG